MDIMHLNCTLYTDLPIDEWDERLAVEELEIRAELGVCWMWICMDYCAVPFTIY